MSEDSVIQAARAVLLIKGLHGFSLEAVAARLSVDPGSIDGTVDDLLVEVLADGLAVEPVANSDNSDTEIGFMIRAMAAQHTHQQKYQAALLGLTAGRDPDAARALTERCTARSREAFTIVLRRAVDRGDLPTDTDFDLLYDIVAGTIAYRHVVAGRSPAAALDRQLVDMMLRGMAPLGEAPRPDPRPVQGDVQWWLEELFWWFRDFGFGHLRPSADAPVRALAAVPAETVVDGHPVTIQAGMWRDREAFDEQDPVRMILMINVLPAGTGVLPPFLRADRVTVVHPDEVWVAPLVEEAPRFRTSRRLEVFARHGPDWQPGTSVDVIVNLVGDHEQRYPVRAAGCVIGELL